MQEKTVYHYDFFFLSCFVLWWVQFQISSWKVTACLPTRAFKKNPSWSYFQEIVIEKDFFKWRASSKSAQEALQG